MRWPNICGVPKLPITLGTRQLQILKNILDHKYDDRYMMFEIIGTTYTYIQTYKPTSIHACICLSIHTSMHPTIHTYMGYMHICMIHTYKHITIHNAFIHPSINTWIYRSIHPSIQFGHAEPYQRSIGTILAFKMKGREKKWERITEGEG